VSIAAALSLGVSDPGSLVVIRRTTKHLLSVVILAVALSACGDDPFSIPWVESPGETELYALDRQELNRPSAYNMFERLRVVVESAGSQNRWDFALDRQDGGLVLLPPSVLGVQSRAGIAPVPGAEYDEVREAPADTLAFITNAPVPVQMGTIYVIRTFDQSGRFGERCNYYGRLEPLEIDVEAGVLLFKHDTSPECNNRRLVPPGS